MATGENLIEQLFVESLQGRYGYTSININHILSVTFTLAVLLPLHGFVVQHSLPRFLVPNTLHFWESIQGLFRCC